MPDQQYYMHSLLPLHKGKLLANGDGSVSVDPHKAFRHLVRRYRDGKGSQHGGVDGLIYAVWKLPLESQKWNIRRAHQWAVDHVTAAEVHTTFESNSWKTVVTAVHPNNPILFRED
jgi:hypothetical protein